MKKILAAVLALTLASADALKTVGQTTPVTIRCAITVIATVPILIVYPFLQQYFVTGIAVGSVKE